MSAKGILNRIGIFIANFYGVSSALSLVVMCIAYLIALYGGKDNPIDSGPFILCLIVSALYLPWLYRRTFKKINL